MTQALLNNLNIKSDSSFCKKDCSLKNVGTDFSKIFDSKTITEKANSKTTTNPQTIQSNTPQTIGDMKVNLNSKEEFKTEFNNAIQDSAAEAIADTVSIITEIICTKDDSVANNIEIIAEDKINTTEDEINTITDELIDTIITEEDSTMYNELNTLENPTVAILLHSQIQTTAKSIVYNNETETEENNNSITLTKTNYKNLNDTNLFKQFDNVSTEDTTVNLPKSDMTLKPDGKNLNKVLDEKIVKDLNIQITNTETEAETQADDFMNQQTPQEQSAKVLIQGDIKFDKIQLDAAKTIEVKPAEISSNKIIEQIAKQLDGMYNNTKLNIVLNPGSLGKVNLHIINSKDGLMAQFTVTTQDAKDLLIKGLNGLKESLLAQGVTVDNVSVKLEESSSDNQQDWTEKEGSRGGNKQQSSQKQQKEQEKPFEQMMFELNNNDKV